MKVVRIALGGRRPVAGSSAETMLRKRYQAPRFTLATPIWFVLFSASIGALAADAPVRSVGVIGPKREEVARQTVISANVRPYEQAEIVAKASGYVKTVSVEIGDAVESGGVLAELSIPEMVKELKQAEAERLKAAAELRKTAARQKLEQLNFNRAAKLREDGAWTEAQLEEARAKFEAAAALVEFAQAETNLITAKIERLQTLIDYATLRAPFDGVVTERNVDPGDFVRSAAEAIGQNLFTVTRSDKVRIQMEISESDAAAIRPGETEVQLKFNSIENTPISAPVTRMASALDPRMRTMLAEIELPNPEGKILPGMYAVATVFLTKRSGALMIPSGAVRNDGDGSFVWAVENDQVVRKPVKIGLDDGRKAEVLSGINNQSLVIAAAPAGLAAGTRVAAKQNDW